MSKYHTKLSLREAICLALVWDSPLWKGQICERYELRKGKRLTPGNAIAILNVLEDAGLVMSKLGPIPRRGGRPRKYYKITQAGLMELADFRALTAMA